MQHKHFKARDDHKEGNATNETNEEKEMKKKKDKWERWSERKKSNKDKGRRYIHNHGKSVGQINKRQYKRNKYMTKSHKGKKRKQKAYGIGLAEVHASVCCL